MRGRRSSTASTWTARHSATWVNEQAGQDLTPLIDLWLDSPRTPHDGVQPLDR